MRLLNIALIGASGTIGLPLLTALRAHPTFIPYVLNRHSSRSIYPRTRVIMVPDDLSIPSVAALLEDNEIDALIIAIAGSRVQEQKRLIEAAWQGGVKRVIPAEFGSCDSADQKTVELLPLMEGKKRVREFLEEVCARGEGKVGRPKGRGKMSWTSVVTGHFFDWGLGNGFMKVDLGGRKAWVYDGGETRFSACTLGFVAQAVLRVLEREEQTENRMLYVHSLSVTQREVVKAVEKVLGEGFEVVDERSEEAIAKARARMLEGDKEAAEDVVAVWGMVASDWSAREGFANNLLGLEEEVLEDVVRRVWEEHRRK
ncbi:isoflavone reductase family protein [Westerdykella ornata]|uniref:Isoflavone reductase family protein n=1 Tax=Westerdykella ornata TaxID=318751 RepID=A0A6A6JXP9_WESOR|nr:isoflavone reductase family protein [Westerdykella ornata]KAF2280588.1 isoflavone reductase family protein [Westerdykella ornata]